MDLIAATRAEGGLVYIEELENAQKLIDSLTN